MWKDILEKTKMKEYINVGNTEDVQRTQGIKRKREDKRRIKKESRRKGKKPPERNVKEKWSEDK